MLGRQRTRLQLHSTHTRAPSQAQERPPPEFGIALLEELAAAGRTLGLRALEEACAGSATGGAAWEPLASRQLSGMLLLVFVRRRLLPHCGAPATAAAACGIMGVGGNKGGVGVRVTLFRRTVRTRVLCCVLTWHTPPPG